MPSSRRSKPWITSCVCFLLCACTADRATSPAAEEPWLQSAAGIGVPETEMRERLAYATRLLAMALSDSALRQRVRQALSGSRMREHKLHFRSFARGNGAPVLAAMAGLARRSPSSVFALLDSLVDLELYLPVREHFARWDGGGDLIVATALRDPETPVGYDLTGREVRLTSATPPAVPTLALVPTETGLAWASFELLDCGGDCGGGGGGTGGGGGGGGGAGGGAGIAAGDSLLLVESHIYDTRESWIRGSPEIMMVVFQYDTNIQDFVSVLCAGDGQPQPYGFDQNDNSWSGRALLGSRSLFPGYDVGSEPPSPLQIMAVWENDNDPKCDYVSERENEELLRQSVQAQSAGHLLRTVRSEDSGSWQLQLLPLVGVALIVHWFISAGDDLIGLVSLPPQASGFAQPRQIVRFYSDGAVEAGRLRFEIH